MHGRVDNQQRQSIFPWTGVLAFGSPCRRDAGTRPILCESVWLPSRAESDRSPDKEEIPAPCSIFRKDWVRHGLYHDGLDTLSLFAILASRDRSTNLGYPVRRRFQGVIWRNSSLPFFFFLFFFFVFFFWGGGRKKKSNPRPFLFCQCAHR